MLESPIWIWERWRSEWTACGMRGEKANQERLCGSECVLWRRRRRTYNATQKPSHELCVAENDCLCGSERDVQMKVASILAAEVEYRQRSAFPVGRVDVYDGKHVA